MASVAEVGSPSRGRFFLSYAAVAAAFGVAEYVLEMVPRAIYNSFHYPTWVLGLANATVRSLLVPFALFLVFYLLAERRRVSLAASRFGVGLSIFLGTLLIFIPVDMGQVVSGTTLPGFTVFEAAVIAVGQAVSASLNHFFIGLSGVLLWQVTSRQPDIEGYLVRKRLHGTEDVSIPGVIMVIVFAWQYLAEAYQATYQAHPSHQGLVAAIALLLGGGTSVYYSIETLQQIILLQALPFFLYFFVARLEGLNPFVQWQKIAVVVFLWALFLHIFGPYFYVYAAQALDPAAFPGQTLATSVVGEFTAATMIGNVATSATFATLGLTACLFGFFSAEKAARLSPTVAPRGRQELSDC
jgi:hypothetical protein